MKCPHCGVEINVGKVLGGVRSEAKSRAVRENGKKGGRPRSGVSMLPSGAPRVMDVMKEVGKPFPCGAGNVVESKPSPMTALEALEERRKAGLVVQSKPARVYTAAELAELERNRVENEKRMKAYG